MKYKPLIEGCIKEDKTAKRALYDLVTPLLRKRIAKKTANPDKAYELCFEILVRMYLRIEQADPNNFESWLATIEEEVLNEML